MGQQAGAALAAKSKYFARPKYLAEDLKNNALARRGRALDFASSGRNPLSARHLLPRGEWAVPAILVLVRIYAVNGQSFRLLSDLPHLSSSYFSQIKRGMTGEIGAR